METRSVARDVLVAIGLVTLALFLWKILPVLMLAFAGIVLAVWPDAFRPLFAADALTYAIFAVWLVWLGELRRTGAAE